MSEYFTVTTPKGSRKTRNVEELFSWLSDPRIFQIIDNVYVIDNYYRVFGASQGFRDFLIWKGLIQCCTSCKQ